MIGTLSESRAKKATSTSEMPKNEIIKSRSTASARLSANAHWIQTQRQSPYTGNGGCCSLLHSAKPSPYYRPLRDRNLNLTLRQCNSDVKTRILAFDLDLWPTTLTSNPNLAKVKVDLHTEYQGHRSDGSAVRALTDGWTDATKRIISLFC